MHWLKATRLKNQQAVGLAHGGRGSSAGLSGLGKAVQPPQVGKYLIYAAAGVAVLTMGALVWRVATR